VLIGTPLRDGAVEVVVDPADVPATTPRVTAVQVDGALGWTFGCPNCGTHHRHGLVPLPALVHPWCGQTLLLLPVD
jgi:hypothetical protein